MMKTLSLIFMLATTQLAAQDTLEWTMLPELPGGKGWAGMYAGVSHQALICMGGANFPAQAPWEGGKKKWYDDIYILEAGKNWKKTAEKLPVPGGYGVSITYRNKVILVGGGNEQGHFNQVTGYEWNGKALQTTAYPPLLQPLANMAGALLNEVIIITGGSSSPAGSALKKCYVLDLQRPADGWAEIEAWPGPERIFPVCTVYEGRFYMFGGETTGLNRKGEKFRDILQDGYVLRINRAAGKWAAEWEKLPTPMPRGMSAGGTLLPVLQNDRFLFWGGVDAVTASYKDPATHPGIIQNILYYFPQTDRWEFIGCQTKIASRVTLPVVYWNGQWIYISGEIKPGVRTPSVIGVK